MLKVVLKISNYYCKNNWQLKVYRPKTEKMDMGDPGWVSLRIFISIQQKDKCAMCKKELLIKEFTLHHIIPRIKGGENNIENLIGLCGKCHDIAELEELNRNEIMNYYKQAKTIKKEKAKIKDWHMWVYGGYNRPGIEKKYNINKPISIINDIIKRKEYKCPDEIQLKEKYTIKKHCSKYVMKYGFTFKEMMYILRMTHNTLIYRLSIPKYEKEIRNTLNNFK